MKREKKGEAAQKEGVKQLNPAEKSTAPIARIITHLCSKVNFSGRAEVAR